MSNEEAITLLKEWEKVLYGEGEYFEALDLAIKALEKQMPKCEDCNVLFDEITNCAACIEYLYTLLRNVRTVEDYKLIKSCIMSDKLRHRQYMSMLYENVDCKNCNVMLNDDLR